MFQAGLAVRCVKTRVACTGDGWMGFEEGRGVVCVGWLGEEWDACLNWDVFSELAVCIKSLRCYADGKKHQSVRSLTRSSLNLYQDDDDVKPSPCRGDPSVLQQAGCSQLYSAEYVDTVPPTKC